METAAAAAAADESGAPCSLMTSSLPPCDVIEPPPPYASAFSVVDRPAELQLTGKFWRFMSIVICVYYFIGENKFWGILLQKD